MRLAIIGSRDFVDYELFKKIIHMYFYDCYSTEDDNVEYYAFSEIISGGAKGADSLARKFAKEFGIKLIEFLPDWDKHGKSAGFIRNEDIIKNCDMVLAFWMNESKGTGHSLSLAKKYKKNSLIIYI